jgi:hypothetical protein
VTVGVPTDTVQTSADNARIKAEETSRAAAASSESQIGGGKVTAGVPTGTVQTSADNARIKAEETSRAAAASSESQDGGGKVTVGVPTDTVQTSADNARIKAEETSRAAAASSESQDGGAGKVTAGVPEGTVQTSADNARINAEETSRANAAYDSGRTLINRPNSGADVSSLHVKAITENNLFPFEREADGKFKTDIPSFSIEYNPRYTQVFGHIVSAPFRALDAVNNRIGALFDALDAAGTGGQVAAASMRGLGTALGSIGDAMDVLGIVQTFGDAMFYTKFNGEESRYLNGQILRDNLAFSIEQQNVAIESYNSKIDTKNNGPNPPSEPYAKIQYPLISGPLDLVDTVNHSPFYAQIRVETEIDSVRERLLRTETEHKQTFITLTSQSFYDSKKNDPTKTLVSYIDDIFGGIQSDNLYRDAFTKVCTYYKGVVFEDKYPDDDTTGRGGRARFQCGWGTPVECETSAKKWFDSMYTTKKDPPGNYAEWFNFTEFNTILGSDGTPVVSIPPETFAGNPTGACIVTNSGIRSMCRKYNGTYANHTCEYTIEYCQSIGTCFDTSTKSCYLPPDTMEGLAIGFGTGGVREFIKINGCQFTSGMSTNPMDTFQFLTKTGSRFIQDILANQPHWNEGFRQVLKNPANSLNFASSVFGVAAFAGPSSFARFAGPLSIVIGVAGAIVSVTDMIRDNAEQRMKPTVDKQEYTTGGWNIGGPTEPGPNNKPARYLPKSVTFLNGWVTRPLKYHPADQPTNPYTSVKDFPEVEKIWMFDTRFIGDGRIATSCDSGYTWNLAGATYLGGRNIGQQTCWENASTGQYTKIRAGSHNCDNEVWCIPAFPGESLAVSTIGPLATGSTKWLTNNVWTSGEFPGYPMFPSQPYSDGDNSSSTFYYQLVYDKDNIDQNNMWNNLTLMRQYFSEATINNMRWYYCSKFIKSCPSGTCSDGRLINPKCYGYLTLETSLYKSLRMTVAKPGIADQATVAGYAQFMSQYMAGL